VKRTSTNIRWKLIACFECQWKALITAFETNPKLM
jgi:hypothetical protein